MKKLENVVFLFGDCCQIHKDNPIYGWLNLIAESGLQ